MKEWERKLGEVDAGVSGMGALESELEYPAFPLPENPTAARFARRVLKKNRKVLLKN